MAREPNRIWRRHHSNIPRPFTFSTNQLKAIKQPPRQTMNEAGRKTEKKESNLAINIMFTLIFTVGILLGMVVTAVALSPGTDAHPCQGGGTSSPTRTMPTASGSPTSQ